MTETQANPYLALGVRPFINCCSVRTMHGGSLILPKCHSPHGKHKQCDYSLHSSASF